MKTIPFKRKPCNKFSSESPPPFASQGTPRVNASPSQSPEAARRDATTFRFKLGVLCMVLLLLVMMVVYLATPRRAALRTSSMNDGAADLQAKNSTCQRGSAQEQYAKYLNAIASARVVRVVAKSKPRANSAMTLCGKLIPYKKRKFAVDIATLETFNFDGELHFNFSSQGEQVDVVLSGGKGFKWVTVADEEAVGGELVVHSGCLLPSYVPALSALGNEKTAKSAKWVHVRSQSAADAAKTSCNLAALEIKFAGESYFVSKQSVPNDDDFPLDCLEADGDLQSESQDGQITKLLRVESADLVMYLGLQTEGSAATLQGISLDISGILLCPDLPTAICINQVDTSQLSTDDAAEGNAVNPSAFHGWGADELSQLPEAYHPGADDLPVADFSTSDCSCRNGIKTCLFVHGIGVHEDVGVLDNFEDYWGKQVKDALPCCSVVKFTHFDAVDPPWYSREMSRKLCRAAIAVSKNETYQISNSSSSTNSTSTTTTSSKKKISPKDDDEEDCKSHKALKDMVVIAHSTGNLHLASAFLYGDCELDPESSRWIAIQGPMGGTMTANRVIKDCQQPNTTWDDLTKQVLVEFKLCPITNSTKSLALQGTHSAGTCLDTLYEKASKEFRSRVYANMCGVSPVGILSSSSARFVALAKFSNHTSKENDGAVEFESCRGGVNATEFDSSFTSRLYKAEINHDDGRMIHGDGGWGETRKPLKWLQCQF